MKVTIDTKEDSHEDIKKVLHILNQIIHYKEPSSVGSSLQTPTEKVDTTNLMSMFGSDSSSPASSATSSLPSTPAPSDTLEIPQSQGATSLGIPVQDDTPPDFSSFLNLTKKEEKKEPKVEFF